MSCITEILKLKGNEPVLLPVDKGGDPWIAVEGGGTYKNYEYLIVLNTRGHRCGYVALPPNHPANNVGEVKRGFSNDYELNYEDINVSCHGGLTFGGKDHNLKNLLSIPCTDNWIGFDCGHYLDKSDFECLAKYFPPLTAREREHLEIMSLEGEVRDFNYTENQCKHIIDQLIELEAA